MKQVRFLIVILFSLFAFVANSQKVTNSKIGEEFKRPGDEIWYIQYFQKDSFYCRGTDRTACMFKTTFDTVVKVISADPHLNIENIKMVIKSGGSMLLSENTLKNKFSKNFSYWGFAFKYPVDQMFISYDSKKGIIETSFRRIETDTQLDYISIFSTIFFTLILVFYTQFATHPPSYYSNRFHGLTLVCISWLVVMIYSMLLLQLFFGDEFTQGWISGWGISIPSFCYCFLLFISEMRKESHVVDSIDEFSGKKVLVLFLSGIILSFLGITAVFVLQSNWIKGIYEIGTFICAWLVTYSVAYIIQKSKGKRFHRLSF